MIRASTSAIFVTFSGVQDPTVAMTKYRGKKTRPRRARPPNRSDLTTVLISPTGYKVLVPTARALPLELLLRSLLRLCGLGGRFMSVPFPRQPTQLNSVKELADRYMPWLANRLLWELDANPAVRR